jgi:peptidoglycan/LPS O-acetylase OafA/YrhL
MTTGAAAPAGGGYVLGYRPAFDGVRGVGILLIMAAHSISLRFWPAGAIALDTFFALSGFLITVLLVREWQRYGRVSLRNFYIRRALRLFPALFVFLLASCVVVAWTQPSHFTNHLRAVLAALFYVYNWTFVWQWLPPPHLLGHCWTLAVEEQFYLLWPFLVLGLLRLPVGRAWKLAFVAAGIAASLIQRDILGAQDATQAHASVGTDVHADALLLGCLVALAACWGMLPQRTASIRMLKRLGFVALLLLLWHAVYPSNDQIWLQMMVSGGWQAFRIVAIACMFVALVCTPPTTGLRILEWPVFVWFGRRSYSLYLWHSAIPYLALAAIVGDVRWPAALTAANAAAAIAIAALSFRWLETPFLKMKTRFSSEPAAAMTVLAQTEDAATPAGESAQAGKLPA